MELLRPNRTLSDPVELPRGMSAFVPRRIHVQKKAGDQRRLL
jgi:hypothetical protein